MRWRNSPLPILLMVTASCSIPFLLQKERSPLKMFSHRVHEGVTKGRFSCLSCHPFHAGIKKRRGETEKVSRVLLYPGREVCHECHEKGEEAAPRACYTCHLDMKEIVPENHTADYREAHGTDAALDGESCSSCHRSYFCTRCHLERDTTEYYPHSAIFRYYHSLEARIDPGRCETCHLARFCYDCHSGRGVNR